MTPYTPPFTITPDILRLVAEISEWIGRYAVTAAAALTPQLRRLNRIRTIQGSLAIEGNTLSMEQVTAIVDGKRVLGSPRELQEVRNAIVAYEGMDTWRPDSVNDLLSAHKAMMLGLVDRPGEFRLGGVGIKRGDEVVFIAPPASRVRGQIEDLLAWLADSKDHPLIASCVFHYEFEFIHPFIDGNGRMGRLWQTLILSRWQRPFSHIPIEGVIRDYQSGYYQALTASNAAGASTPFILFMLTIIRDAVYGMTTEQVTEQATEQVTQLMHAMGKETHTARELMTTLKLSHRPTFLYNYLQPALAGGWIEMTDPASPRSPRQRYRLTAQGRGVLATRHHP
jgi:Fic family protein